MPMTSEQKRQARSVLKDAALQAYGRLCACCGIEGPQFLTIDHVGGWGGQHRRDESARNIYFWLKKHGYPQNGKFRTLCWNCNCAQGVYGFCHDPVTENAM